LAIQPSGLSLEDESWRAAMCPACISIYRSALQRVLPQAHSVLLVVFLVPNMEKTPFVPRPRLLGSKEWV
jgi:hypothetical protein